MANGDAEIVKKLSTSLNLNAHTSSDVRNVLMNDELNPESVKFVALKSLRAVHQPAY